MRVIGGQYGGRRLAAPPGSRTRPTSDRVREALFSRLEALGNPVEGARVLDAFAGSGALGIESLSRGAAHVTFVDVDPAAVRVIRRNLESLGLTDSATVAQSNISRYIKRGAGHDGPFSLLFLDPPYRINKSEVTRAIETLDRAGFLTEEIVAVWEYSSASEIEWPSSFTSVGPKVYGDTAVDIAVRRVE